MAINALGDPLAIARQLAARGQFEPFTRECDRLAREHADNTVMQQELGLLYSAYGFMGHARACLERAAALAPADLGNIANLATVARDAGHHAEARRLYETLLHQLPNHPVVRRNHLTGLEYDPAVSDAERLRAASDWGEWAVSRAGGERPRPGFAPMQGRPLRVGYVGADFCQHTVGLFVKDVLKAHDRSRVQVFVYSAGQQNDWVTQEISGASAFRQVAAMDDNTLAAQIRGDAIDVLVDLSGHTAGSRLTAFAHRPAPVLVAWLGYFATTGLPCMDAVLLDEWHAPPGTESQFVERVIRLPQGRFCYQPAPWAPGEVASAPCLRNGWVTFGCFNNTAKLNSTVFGLWSRILNAVPDSRLILKWRSFNDPGFRREVTQAFVEQNIRPERIELRGPSFHTDLLKQYGDIDIALDPFPFTGGLTSCEALYMGVPVITWPQSRVVSRQTHALLHQIGRPEFSAADAEAYVQKAVSLAANIGMLTDTRSGLRASMRDSALMDVAGFTRQLEDAMIGLFRELAYAA